MSLVFNEAALNFLLENPDGALGRKLDRIGNQIAGNYEAVVNVVWENQSPAALPTVDYTVTVGENGLQAVIGFPSGQGHVSEYMAEKFGDLESDRIVPALMTNWDGV